MHREGASGLAAGDRRRARRLERDDADVGAFAFQRLRDADDGARGADALDERVDATARLLPDLAAERVAHAGDRVRVVELIGRVMPRLRCEPGGADGHAPYVLRRHAPLRLDRRNDVDIRAECTHQLDPLVAEAVRDDDQRPVALRAADERERRPGAAARVLDDRGAWFEQPVALGALDHRERHAVLDRAARIRCSSLTQTSTPFAAARLRSRTSGVLPIASRTDDIQA